MNYKVNKEFGILQVIIDFFEDHLRQAQADIGVRGKFVYQSNEMLVTLSSSKELISPSNFFPETSLRYPDVEGNIALMSVHLKGD